MTATGVWLLLCGVLVYGLAVLAVSEWRARKVRRRL